MWDHVVKVPVLQLLRDPLLLVLLGGQSLRAIVAVPMVVLQDQEIQGCQSSLSRYSCSLPPCHPNIPALSHPSILKFLLFPAPPHLVLLLQEHLQDLLCKEEEVEAPKHHSRFGNIIIFLRVESKCLQAGGDTGEDEEQALAVSFICLCP